MASSKPRNKKYNRNHSKARHISSVINQCLAKFQIIGDDKHEPLAFHYAAMSSHLKGTDLVVGLNELNNFLLVETRPWTVLYLNFFRDGETIENVPVNVVYPDCNLRILGREFESNREVVMESLAEAGYDLSERIFTAFFITYGDELNTDLIESQLSDKILRVTNNLTNIGTTRVLITEENMVNALKRDKFSLANSDALKTDYKEVSEND